MEEFIIKDAHENQYFKGYINNQANFTTNKKMAKRYNVWIIAKICAWWLGGYNVESV